ncbi:hypothetical protein ACSBR2_013356 [Camellia fascicularis]
MTNPSSFNILIIFFFLFSNTLFLIPTHQYRPLDPLTPSKLNQVRNIVQGSNPNTHNLPSNT